MTKTLQEIQQENREWIKKAIYGTAEEVRYNPDFSLEIRGNYSFLPMTLSRVLLSLKNCIELDEESLSGNWLNMWWKIGEPCIAWDLTKETLEEQSEGTQRQINQLLNNK